MPAGKIFPLEFGFEQMGAIDFQKGCFIGQEVTSRVHRKGSLRKTLWVVKSGSLYIGAELMNGERPCGEVVAVSGAHGLALIRNDALDAQITLDGQSVAVMGGLFAPN